jgi:putative transposase
MKPAPQEIRTFFATFVSWGRRSIFKAEPLSRLLLDTMESYRRQRKYLLHEFVIMPDHLHLLLTPAPDISLERAVQFIKGGFSYRVKKEMHSNLLIWENSFTNHRIRDAADYGQHCDYIHQNPVRAKLVEVPEAYPYSSACGKFQLDPPPPGLKPHVFAVASSQA